MNECERSMGSSLNGAGQQGRVHGHAFRDACCTWNARRIKPLCTSEFLKRSWTCPCNSAEKKDVVHVPGIPYLSELLGESPRS